MVGYDMTKAAATEPYEKTGLRPKDVQVIELHDCFTTNEKAGSSTRETAGSVEERNALQGGVKHGEARVGERVEA